METPAVTAADEDRVHLMPEYLTVCAWHSIKEVSLLLGQLTSTAPIIDPGRVSDLSSEATDPYNPDCSQAEKSDGLLTVELVSEHSTNAYTVFVCFFFNA